MSLIEFPTDRIRPGADRIETATAYRLKAAELGRQMVGETDPHELKEFMMSALSMIQLAENEEWLAGRVEKKG